MKSAFLRFLIITAILTHVPFSAFAARYVLGVGASSPEAQTYATATQAQMFPSETVKFDNGNSFVRFGMDCYGHDVTMVLPKSMTGDQFIEVLLKLRTLQTNGAKSISVAADGQLSTTSIVTADGRKLNLDLNRLLSVAGAQKVIENGRVTNLARAQTPRARSVVGPAIVAGASHPELAKALAAKMSAPHFNSINNIGVRGTQVFWVTGTIQNVNDEILTTLEAAFKARRSGASFNIVSPNLAYARSDKIDQPGITVGGRLIADIYQYAGADSITFMRAHAPQSQGFFTIPNTQLWGGKTINNYLSQKGIDMVVAPDAGAAKDDAKYAELLGVELGNVNKARDPITTKVKIVGFSSVGDVRGKRVVIIDDETASGSTLAQAAEYLKGLGAKEVIAVVTHLTGNALKAIDSPHLDEIVVTDTLPVNSKNGKLTVLSIVGEVISSIQKMLPINCKSLMM